jgi:flagellar protein FliL
MAAKTEAPPPAAEAASAPPKGGGTMGTLLPVILVLLLAPAISWAVAQFVIVPQLKQSLSAGGDAAGGDAHGGAAAADGHGGKPAKDSGGHGKKGETGGGGNSYTFENVVVNLAGTMGTRYLKVSFMVTGAEASLRAQFEGNKPKLVDVTLNVLSSLTLSDLEEAGAKNIIREKLASAYNQALGRRVVEQIYFADFVVQ